MSSLDQPIRFAVLGIFLALVAGSLGACNGSGPGRRGEDAPETSKVLTTSTPVNACGLLSEQDIAGVVGNPVEKGRPYAGPEVCKWDTGDPGQVDVLLTARPKGSTREQVLCPDVRERAAAGSSVAGLGDVATWKFSNMGFFNSGELEACGAAGYLSVALDGSRDELVLRAAAIALAHKAWKQP